MSDTVRPLETAAPVDLTKPPLHLVPDLPDDPAGDLPLIPAWTRNSEGRKAAARRVTRPARRSGRRRTPGPPTAQGHAAQTARGVRRPREGVLGSHGGPRQAAPPRAHGATKGAGDAARRARFTFMPGQRDKARQ